MKIYKLLKVFFLSAGITAISCSKEEYKEPLEKNAAIPEKLLDVKVDNAPGGAKITYGIPNDPNILYVKAAYTLASGVQKVSKSSFYANSIMVEGYADTLEHEVELYTVSRSQIESDPLEVKIKPLKAPIYKVFNSIKIKNAFGGYNLTAQNPDSADVDILVLKKNELGEFEVDNNKSVFTSATGIDSKIRGLDTINYNFKYVVMDKWGNSTDTLAQNIKPLYETEIPKEDFDALELPGDAPQVTNGARLEFAWNGRVGWPNTSFTDQSRGGPDPHMVTFDIGMEAKLSRIKIIPYREYFTPPQYFYLTTLKRFEIYGSTDPSLDGELDESWILLGYFELEKPSGSPYGQDTPEDRLYAAKGIDFEFDVDLPKVRYLRVRCLENYGGGTAQSMNEIYVFGDPR